MKNVTVILCLVLMCLNISCSQAKPVEFKPIPIDEEALGKVGPYVLDFSKTDVFESKVQIDINQEDGKIEYFSLPNETNPIKIDSFSAELAGCDAKNSDVGLIWYSDSLSKETAQVVTPPQVVMVHPNKKGLLLVAFLGIGNCSKLKLNLRVERLRPPQLPKELLGSWNQLIDYGAFKTELRMEISANSSGTTDVSYWTNCGSGTESFLGTIDSFKAGTPNRVSFKIKHVTKAFYGACGNVLALDEGDAGQFVNCLAVKSNQGQNFELSCVLSRSAEEFPSALGLGDINWRK